MTLQIYVFQLIKQSFLMPLFVKIYISDLFVLHNYFNINSLGSLSSHFTSGNKLSLNTTTIVLLSLNPHVYLRLNGLVEYINNFPLSSLAIHITYSSHSILIVPKYDGGQLLTASSLLGNTPTANVSP